MDDWRDNAACKNEPAHVWFSDSPALIEVAKRICGTCEVRRDCLDYAIENREQHGVWGGEDLGGREKERKARRRQLLERRQRVA
jgi:WhiB family redox-sensing transcriptional regulator